MKPPAFHRRNQACGGCGFPLHVSDAAALLSQGVKREQDAKFKPADPGAQAEDVSDGKFGT
jgi:hypothetical protein